MRQAAENVVSLPQLPLFEGLPEELRSELLRTATLRRFTKHSMVFLHSDRCDTCYLVLDGKLKIFNETPDGNEWITRLLFAGDIFGTEYLFGSRQLHHLNAQTLSPTKVLTFPLASLRRVFRRCPTLAENLLETQTRAMQHMQMRHEQFLTFSALERTACFFLTESHRQHSLDTRSRFHLPVRKSTLALYLGMKLETLSRCLAKLRVFAVQMDSPAISLARPELLKAQCCSKCSLQFECPASLAVERITAGIDDKMA